MKQWGVHVLDDVDVAFGVSFNASKPCVASCDVSKTSRKSDSSNTWIRKACNFTGSVVSQLCWGEGAKSQDSPRLLLCVMCSTALWNVMHYRERPVGEEHLAADKENRETTEEADCNTTNDHRWIGKDRGMSSVKWLLLLGKVTERKKKEHREVQSRWDRPQPCMYKGDSEVEKEKEKKKEEKKIASAREPPCESREVHVVS